MHTSGQTTPKRLLPAFALAVGLLALPAPSRAAFHRWEIIEVFSNADGSIQYVELFSPFAGEQFVGGHVLQATSTTGATPTVRSITFGQDLSGGSTENEHFLVATPGFEKLPGAPVPDYVLPCGPFFDPGADSIVIDFMGADTVSFTAGQIPVNGTQAADDTGSPVAATPEAFLGSPGSLALTPCQTSGACDACDDGSFCNGAEACASGICSTSDPCPGQLCDEITDACVECMGPGDCSDGLYCNGAETCTLGACGSGNAPCIGEEMCDEAADACVECLTAGDCDDDNPCTDDGCPSGTCTHADNTATCDDGSFCTATDVCAGGACTGSGDPCPGQNCLEGSNSCGDCLTDADCDDGNPCTVNTCDTTNACVTTNAADGSSCDDDGRYCTGAESCQAGACTGEGDPCPAPTTCDDTLDACRSGCGDAIVAGSEDCDDGNQTSGDGCSETCELEAGYACSTQGNASTCDVVHGDGIVAGNEECDDGNQIADDGCTSGRVDPGYRCDDATPNACTEELPDAGAPDGGGGAATEDAGDAVIDAAMPAEDAGGPSTERDAASSSDGDAAAAEDSAADDTGGDADDGCSCGTAVPPSPGATLPWLACLAILGLRARRRRRP